jgi:SNF2 family DNA or RNA helicase
MPYSSIKDNFNHGKLGEYLRAKIKDDATLSFVSAYFTIYAYEKLQERLNNISSLRFLFGEPTFVKAIDPSKQTYRSYKIEDENIMLDTVLTQKKIASDCVDWIKEKVEIKSIARANFLHGKLYHINNAGVDEAIFGSSNFTVSGLGFSENPNIELNLEINDRRDRNEMKEWFDEIWNDEELVKDVKQEVINYLEQLYRNQAPEFIYFKTLYHIFSKFLGDHATDWVMKQNIQITETEIWKTLFEFQKDAVKGAINKINNHNGCIIADSVGLGKTYEALAIIKYYELLNDRVLVLCPKKLRENWTKYQAQNASKLNPFLKDRFSYTVLSHTDLSRKRGRSGDVDLATINWGNFDLIVIDESHNFRNNTPGKRDEDGQIIRKSRYQRMMEDIIRSGIKTKVLMLSATPVNTDLSDLRNQLYFITEGKDDAFAGSLNIPNIKNTLTNAQKTFSIWADPKRNPHRNSRDLMERLDSDFFKILDELTIARSRKHIKQYYSKEMERIGAFPQRAKPVSIYPEIACNGARFMSYDKLNDEISGYKLSLFSPSFYILSEYRPIYIERNQGTRFTQFTQKDRENFLIGMMKVNFLKRLESSVQSFTITIDRTIKKIDHILEMIDRFERLNPSQDELDYDELRPVDTDDEELDEAFEIGVKITYQLKHLNLKEWKIDLLKDKDQLVVVYNSAVHIKPEQDGKLADLKNLIREKVLHPSINNLGRLNRKVLVFTAFADTAKYLYEALASWIKNELGVHVALVTGGGENKTTFGRTDFNEILTNFCPLSKERDKIDSMPQEEEIDVLIASDCVSEGQNLQDCDYLINYDIHWNPVRVIQRFGRIDRIGSKNNVIQLINFWPTNDLNKYINLKNRVEARMALVDISATAEENILETKDIKELVTEDMKYRDRQLLRLREEVLDLEDFNENISLNEFTLDDFRMELLNYIESNRKALEEAALGLFTVVPSSFHPDYPEIKQMDPNMIIKPGVIFCLKQKGDTSGNEKVNPLDPYFLVYIQEDRTVRFNFVNAKQILEMYRLLCSGKKEAYEQLCTMLDNQTKYGSDMGFYSALMHGVVKAIKSSFIRRNTQTLTTDRNGQIIAPERQVKDLSQFELITWLIIK